MPSGKFWTIQEDNFLKMFYSEPSSSVKDIAAYLGRTEQAVTSRAAYLNLKKVPFYMTNLLTPREQQVYSLLLTEMTYEEIAKELNITKRTVECHTDSILEKKYVNSREQLQLKEKHNESRTNS